MNELYSESSPDKKATMYNPKDETISFLIAYSKALSITSYKSIHFETIMN